jgi:hypothetical protein
MSAQNSDEAELEFRPLATFRGVRGVPLVAVTHNSLYPSLRVGQSYLIIGMIRPKRLAFDTIETIQLARRLAHQITFMPRTGLWSFSANFARKSAAREVLAALSCRGAPLAASARKLLDDMEP